MGERYKRLEDLPGIGKSIAADLREVGVKTPSQLKSANPETIFRKIEKKQGRQDPCLLYVLRCANYAMNAKNPVKNKLKWWNWK